MDELSAKLTADLDQAMAGTKTMAAILGAYFGNLRREKFTRAEALQIVLEYQARVMSQGQGGG